MKKKLITLMTLLLAVCSGAWATQTGLVTNITLPDMPTSSLDLSSQTTFTPNANGWIVFDPYTDIAIGGSAPSWWTYTSRSNQKPGAVFTYGTTISSTAPFVNRENSDAFKINKDIYASIRFTGAEKASFLVHPRSNTDGKKMSISLFTYDSKQSLVSTQTTSANAYHELIFEDLGPGTTYVAYIYKEYNDSQTQNGTLVEIALKSPVYSVTYDDNEATSGSAPTDANTYIYGKSVTVLGNTGSLTKTGYAFNGWNSNTSGTGTDYAVGSTFNISANTTLYAKWTPTSAPSIVTQPASGIYVKDASVTLSVTATPSSGSCSYQWYSTDATKSSSTELVGENGATYSVPTGTAGNYYYYCTVGDGSANTTDTEVARIRISPKAAVSTWDFSSITAEDIRYNTDFWSYSSSTYSHGAYDANTYISAQNNFETDLANGITMGRSGGYATITLVPSKGIYIMGDASKPGTFKVPVELNGYYKITYCSRVADKTTGYAVSGADIVDGTETSTLENQYTSTGYLTVKATNTEMTLANTGTDANNAMLVKIEKIESLSGSWTRSSDEFFWGATAPSIPTLSVTASDAAVLDGSEYSVAYSVKAGSTDGIVEVNASTGITAINNNVIGTATVVATLTSTSSYIIDTETVEYVVTVNARTNTSTTYTAGVVAGTKAVMHNGQRQTDNKSAIIAGVATLYDYSGSTGVQAGSTQTFDVNGQEGLTGLKLSGSRRFAIRPATGVTISNVKCYVRSNSGDATKMYRRYTGGNTYSEVNEAVVDKNTSSPTEIDLTNCYQYGFAFSAQVQAVFLITYGRADVYNVTIKETGFATLWTSGEVAIPDGVQAYWGALNGDKSKLVMTEIEDNIPAETAVILHTETPKTYSFIGSSTSKAAIVGNVLKGQATDKAVEANSVYTLGMDNSTFEVGMRLYSGTSVRAYSAYMNASDVAGARVIKLSFDDEVTSIKDVDNTGSSNKNGIKKYLKDGQLVIESSKGTFTATGIRLK